VTIGCFLSTGSAVAAEVIGQAGFEFVIIDLEHGLGSEQDVLGQLMALKGTATRPYVRVESHERQRVHHMLDLGAEGIMFPRVNSAEEARACVAAMRYPPEGVRGVATLVRATQYGTRFNEYRKAARTTILQIETPEAVQNVDAIAAVDGADVLFVGPMDLSVGMGIYREFDHPDFVAALHKTVAAVRRHGRIAGILLPAASEKAKYRDYGFEFLACGTDLSMLAAGARSILDLLRSESPPH
jgi:4-hydroxy-2-oxoheptanedioate aldolase